MVLSLLSILLLSFSGAFAGYFVARLPRGWPYFAAMVPAVLFTAFLGYLDDVALGKTVTATWNWVPALGVQLSLRLDGFALLFALLITGIGTLVTVYSIAYFSGSSATRRGRFTFFIQVFMTAMLGAVLADDLIAMFVFWEATSLASFLLIGFESGKARARRAALQALLITGGGGLALFAGILLIGMELGTFSMAAITERADKLVRSPYLSVIVVLILVGAFTKSAQFPFHFWLPRAMAAPTPASAYLHSATMVKLGVYLLARFDRVFTGVALFKDVLVVTGVTTMLLAAFNTIRATGYKAVLAQSTVASLGILVMLIGMDGPTSSVAVAGFTLSHALYKAALFFCAGTVIHATHIPELRRLGGLVRALPLTATAAVLASLSMAGLPPFIGFIAKGSLFEAQFESSWSLLPIIAAALVNAVLVAVAAVVSLHPFFGRKNEVTRIHHGETAGLLAGPLALSIVGILLGVVPGLMAQVVIVPAGASLHGAPVDAEFSLWHGLTPKLALSAGVMATGALLAWKWDAFHEIVNRPRLVHRVNASRFYHRAVNALLRLAGHTTSWLQNGDQRRYTLVVSSTVVLLAVHAVAAAGNVEIVLSGGPLQPLPLFLLGLGALGAFVAVRTQSLITALLGAGVFGYACALLFLLNGAPDLALTQFAVETLMLVVLTAILVRVPTIAPRTRARRETVVDVVVSTAFAVLVFLGLANMSAQPFNTRLSDFYGATSYVEAFGKNVVNVILVDYRALDTLGEIAVVGFATLIAWVLLRRRPPARGDRTCPP